MKIYRHSGTHLFLLLWRASHAVVQFDRQSIRKAGFGSLTDFAVLEFLLQKGPQPVNTIGEKVLLTSGSITTAVQRLEKENLVIRRRDETDRRVVRVGLTPRGKALIERSFQAHSERLEDLFGEFTEEERNRFADLICRLGESARKKIDARGDRFPLSARRC